MADAQIGDYPVYADDKVKIGDLYGFEGGLLMHPLDVISLKHPKAPLARLDEAMRWIVRRAVKRLDAIAPTPGTEKQP